MTLPGGLAILWVINQHPRGFAQNQNGVPAPPVPGRHATGLHHACGKVRRMRCPYCGLDNTRVVDSRPADDNYSIRRRRMCDACGKRFTTYEKVESIPLVVIKKDRTREQYDRGKIEAGVMRACYKRPVPVSRINETIDAIETEVYSLEEKEIESKVIGEIVMDKLKVLDPVAYVRFASVYREFKDVSTFMDELKKILTD